MVGVWMPPVMAQVMITFFDACPAISSSPSVTCQVGLNQVRSGAASQSSFHGGLRRLNLRQAWTSDSSPCAASIS